MYEVNGVRLGHALAKSVSSPIILAHGGGAKIHEAFLTAETFSNIYLDTSFSIPYWSNSSVCEDFAFVMDEMNMDRWVWGTDRPFAGHRESVEEVEKLLSEHGLSEMADKLFYENMSSILGSRV
jgi:predicted TIM-barrel fold metal-dependent hydrolase